MPDRLASSTASVPRSLHRNPDGTFFSTGKNGDPTVGTRIHVELQNPANAAAIFTVPAGKTFTGSIVLSGTVAGGTIGVSAATGGTQASLTGVGIDAVDVQIAGGTGNALTAVVAGGAAGVVIVDGYIK